MLRATSVVRAPSVRSERIVDRLTLDHAARHRRRMVLTADGGLSFLLDLERALVLHDGDALRLEDGGLVAIAAAPECLVEIRTESPLRLMKIAWHLGNRHVAAELTDGAIYIAEDRVLVEMVRGLGASARRVERPFRPERGAYDEDAPAAAPHHHGPAHE
jgi:urease accessory protein